MDASTTWEMSPELRSRVRTAVVGLIPMLLLLFFGSRFGVAVIAAIISLGMIHEFSGMVFTLPDQEAKRKVLMGCTWLLAFVNFWIPRSEYELLLFSFLGLFAYFLFTVEAHQEEAMTTHFRELMYSIFGLVYLAFLPLFLVLIRDSAFGLKWTFLFFFLVWGGDTGAYFVGKKYGKRKLFPAISPKKTVEGALGGMGVGAALTLLFKLLFFKELGWGMIVILPLIIGVVAPIGDLCESFLKRAFHRKDSGSILPGHGGFLDRFDGVIFSAPIMYGCIRLFG